MPTLKPPKLDSPLPGEIDFGYGFRVRVLLYSKLRGCDGEWCGLYHSVDPMTIRVSAAAPLWRQHEVLAHEAVHAALDFFQWLRDTLVDEMREEAAKTRTELEERDVRITTKKAARVRGGGREWTRRSSSSSRGRREAEKRRSTRRAS